MAPQKTDIVQSRALSDALGVTDNSHGKQFSMLLSAGLDTILAAEARQSGADADNLVRLRHGSKRPRVRGARLIEYVAAHRASHAQGVDRQAAVETRWSDGIYSPAWMAYSD
jgi:hypothetical protein